MVKPVQVRMWRPTRAETAMPTPPPLEPASPERKWIAANRLSDCHALRLPTRVRLRCGRPISTESEALRHERRLFAAAARAAAMATTSASSSWMAAPAIKRARKAKVVMIGSRSRPPQHTCVSSIGTMRGASPRRTGRTMKASGACCGSSLSVPSSSGAGVARSSTYSHSASAFWISPWYGVWTGLRRSALRSRCAAFSPAEVTGYMARMPRMRMTPAMRP
mmetsp:Transcript_21783/g.70341  ORF Transcript_21783/g.70341 Transcript_21783/m.70341 type:complete len:221 (-) Transcript_21783:689-1351(-)